MANRQTHYRSFLEPTSRNVDSYVRVDIDEYENGRGKGISLKVADCDRTIRLSFDIKDGRRGWGLTKSQALAKLTKLERALRLIRQEIEGS
jgi:hypothetical protein